MDQDPSENATTPVTLIAVGGLSGTGKSVLARALAADLAPGAVLLRSDVERKALFGVAETDRLPVEAYTADATGNVYTSLGQKAERIIAAGRSVIVDAVFSKPEERAAIAAVAKSGTPFRGLFLIADLATRMARVSARLNDASDADASIARQQEAYDLGVIEWTTVDASGTPEDTLRHARAALAR